jgi:hypothetical protein
LRDLILRVCRIEPVRIVSGSTTCGFASRRTYKERMNRRQAACPGAIVPRMTALFAADSSCLDRAKMARQGLLEIGRRPATWSRRGSWLAMGRRFQ